MAALLEVKVGADGVLAGGAGAIAPRFAVDGAVVLRGCERSTVAAALREEGWRLLQEDLAVVPPDARRFGLVYALMTRSRLFLDYMVRPLHLDLFRGLLGHGCIVHHYCLSAVPPAGGSTYATEPHRDTPAARLIPGYPTNVGLFLALEDMDEGNGALQLLPGSHASVAMPAAEEFAAGMVSPRLRAGDAILFDARVVHRGGHNRSGQWRLGLSLHACRAFMRQLFDYPRMVASAGLGPLRPEQEQFLGYWVRMPVSLAEFDLPPEQRPHRPGQE